MHPAQCIVVSAKATGRHVQGENNKNKCSVTVPFIIWLEMHSRSLNIFNWICHQLAKELSNHPTYTTNTRCCHRQSILNNLTLISKPIRSTATVTKTRIADKKEGATATIRNICSATIRTATTTNSDLDRHEEEEEERQEEEQVVVKQLVVGTEFNQNQIIPTRTSLNELTIEEEEQYQYHYNHGRTRDSNNNQGTKKQSTTTTAEEEKEEETEHYNKLSSNHNNIGPDGQHICSHMRRFQNALPFDSIPGPKPSLPFVGTNWIYFPLVGHYQSMKLHEANLDKYHRYGPIMKEEYQRGYPTVTIFNPSDIKEVFMREGACPSRPVLPYVIKHRQSDPSRYPNVGLANMEGPEWFELRSRLAPLLLSRELKRRHISTQNRVSSRLVNYIKSLLPAHDDATRRIRSEFGEEVEEDESEITVVVSSSAKLNHNHHSQRQFNSGIVENIQEVFYRFSMESIMNLCINQELGCLKATSSDSFNAVSSDGELIFQAAMNFFEAQHKLYYGLGLWKYIDSKPYRQLRDSQNSIHDIASKYIDVALIHLKKKRELRSMSKQQCEEHESLLETLYCTNKFNDLEIKSTIVDFVGGGIYTVANTLTMVLFLLASNPAVQEQLYQEICQVFDGEDEIGSDINIDMEKLEQLKFLKLCLKESYRLLPTIPGVARTLQRDMVLSNYLVPKNTLVFCNFMVTCRLPQYFAKPDEYDPSRWERNGKLKNDLAFCLLPFGHGVRKCIGHNFAELEIYVAIAKLIRSFKIKTINGEDAKSLNLCYKFIVVPEKPVTLEFEPRK